MPLRRTHRLLVPLAATCLLGGAAGQDPPVPIGGFPIQELLDRLVTYADGYRTRADLRLPDPARVPPPATGWPAILLIHSWNGNRNDVVDDWARDYASYGYAAITYDVRGQGDTVELNPSGGTSFMGALDKGDMAEMLHWAAATLGPALDFSRLAALGTSQGASLTWAAIAWSERQLPQPRGAITHFPKITAASPGALNPDFGMVCVPDGNSFSSRAILKWFRPGPLLEPGLLATGQQLFLNQDFQGWDDLFRNDPWRQDPQLVKSSKVAVFAHNSWDDWWANVNPMTDAIESMPASTPRAVHISTGEHGSPVNNLDTATWRSLERRWFDAQLKGVPDEMPRQPRYRLSIPPDGDEAYLSVGSVWSWQQLPAFPATGLTQSRTLYLRQGGALDAAPPAALEPTDTVAQSVPAGYGPNQWLATQTCQTPGQPVSTCVVRQLLQDIPVDTVAYVGAPVVADEELLGRPVVRL